MKKLTILLGLFIVFSCEDKPEPDKTPPVVMITNIQVGAELTGIVNVTVDAIDDDEVARVEFFVNGALSGTSESSEAIHTFNWDTDAGDNGSYQIYAKATDKSDNSASSSILSVTVINYRTANFVNTTVAPVAYKIDGGESTWIESLDTAKVQVPKNTTINFYATTPTNWGGTSRNWDFDVDVPDTDVFWSFWVNDYWFFLFTKNNLSVNIKYTRVNKDLTGDDYDNNEIPNNGGEFRQGFFRAHTNTNIYWYLDNHPQYDYWYVDGETHTVDYKVPDASHTDRNLYAKYDLQGFAEANDGIGVESYDDGYMGIPSRDENDTAQGGYGKIEK